MPTGTRTTIHLDSDSPIGVQDRLSGLSGAREAKLLLGHEGDVAICFGRYGSLGDEDIVGLADRILAAVHDLRKAALDRIRQRELVSGRICTCSDPVCPKPHALEASR